MYFWRIDELKAKMASEPLSDQKILPYLIIFVAPIGFWRFFSQSPNLWDQIAAGWGALLSIVGTIYLYRQNGGAAGEHFLQRYFAIGWVVALRWLVLTTTVAILATMSGIMEMGEQTTRWQFVFWAIAELLLFWRIGYHIKDLASRTSH